MKKFITIFILLVAAAGAAGYFGWVKIDPGTFGVAHSSLTGTVSYPLESGRFYWFWQKLIPKSFYVYPVSNKPNTIETEATQPLPGSEMLEQFGNFSIRVNLTVQYSINFESATGLLNNGLLEDFKDFYTDTLTSKLNGSISSFIVENLTRSSRYFGTVDYGALESMKKKIEDMVAEEAGQYRLKDVSFSITFPEIPQIAVYNEALNRYFDYMDELARLKQENLSKNMEYQSKISENDAEIDRWKKYGELIERYPELLKYFYIQKFSEQADVLVLPQDETTGFPKMLDVTPYVLPEKPAQPAPQSALPDKESTQKNTGGAEEKTSVQAPEPATGKIIEEEKSSKETSFKKKWYDSLKFWKLLKKKE